MTLPNITTCTPAEMRALFNATGDPRGSHIVQVNLDGGIELHSSDLAREIGKLSKDRFKFWFHSGDNADKNDIEAVDDASMNYVIGLARGFWAGNRSGLVNDIA
jgi:hypothetical protein